MITFEAVRQVKRAEDKKGLSELPAGFEKEVRDYLGSLDSGEQELRKAKRELEKIYESRSQKIIKMALIESEGGAVEKGNMTGNEMELFQGLLKSLQRSRKKFFSGEKAKKGEREYLKVLFLGDLQTFIGPDAKSYGPYKKDKIVDLPIAIGNLLIKKKLVKRV